MSFLDDWLGVSQTFPSPYREQEIIINAGRTSHEAPAVDTKETFSREERFADFISPPHLDSVLQFERRSHARDANRLLSEEITLSLEEEHEPCLGTIGAISPLQLGTVERS